MRLSNSACEINVSLDNLFFSKSAFTLSKLALKILKTPPEQGYITIPNASQLWLQNQMNAALATDIPKITKIICQN